MCTCAVVLQGTEIAGIKMQIYVSERFVICRHNRCLTMCRLLVDTILRVRRIQQEAGEGYYADRMDSPLQNSIGKRRDHS